MLGQGAEADHEFGNTQEEGANVLTTREAERLTCISKHESELRPGMNAFN